MAEPVQANSTVPRPVYRKPASLKNTVTHFCPGCGHGIALKLVAEALDVLGIREQAIGVAPVGCSVLAYHYLNCDITEAPHGRTPAVATGIKRCRPDRIVFSYQGDGDLAAIGAGETIHTANRGENITVVFINNTVYGMTGGQMAPTTLIGQKTATTPTGRDAAAAGLPIRMCEMINTLDAPWYVERVALDGAAGVRKARKAILAAFKAQVEGKGYSFVEVLSPCPVYFRQTPVQSIEFVRNHMIPHYPVKLFRQEGKPVS